MDIENAAPAEQSAVAEIGNTTDTYSNPLGQQVAVKQPETPAEQPEAKEPAKSPREAVERALAKVKEAPVDTKQEAKPEKPAAKEGENNEPAKDEAKPQAEQPKANADAPEAAKPAEQPQTPEAPKPVKFEAPQRFHEQARQEWESTPESVRAEVNRSLSELENGLNKYRESHEKYETIREYDEMATQYGTTVKDALANYTGIERLLHSDPFTAFEQIIANVAAHKQWRNPDGTPVSFRDVAASYLNMPADRTASRQDTVIRQMNEKITELTNRSAAFEQTMQDNRLRETHEMIQSFAKDHPRVEELADDIAFLLESKRAATLQDAYALADRMNPSQAPLTQAAENPTAQTRDAPSPVNPAGLKSVSGAPSAGSDPRTAGKPSSSPREALQKALRNVQ
ncbi:hypothetical protein [Pseudochrobactrum lubricantis]|uniref:hypothetical protein n=1 Tax=Pseudochrobactrum lubricantis TaxID=558172 RepID=UPI0035D70C8F